MLYMLPEPATICSNCGGIDDPDANSREVKHARTVCQCYVCYVCEARGAPDGGDFCNHGAAYYSLVLPLE